MQGETLMYRTLQNITEPLESVMFWCERDGTKGHTQQAAGFGMEGKHFFYHVTTVDVLTVSHGQRERAYSLWTQCSSCICIFLPSLGHGAVMGLRALHPKPTGLPYLLSPELSV